MKDIAIAFAVVFAFFAVFAVFASFAQGCVWSRGTQGRKPDPFMRVLYRLVSWMAGRKVGDIRWVKSYPHVMGATFVELMTFCERPELLTEEQKAAFTYSFDQERWFGGGWEFDKHYCLPRDELKRLFEETEVVEFIEPHPKLIIHHGIWSEEQVSPYDEDGVLNLHRRVDSRYPTVYDYDHEPPQKFKF